MIKGFDCAARLDFDKAFTLREMGYEYALRYCVPTSYSKALTAQEADCILSAGLSLGLCWETTANRARNGATAGLADGKSAKDCAKAIGAPDGTVIYFAVDYPAAKDDYDRIAAYMLAAEVNVRPYRLGIYGSYYLVEEMGWREIGKAYWQCVAWSDGRVSPHADIYQKEWSVKTPVTTVDNDYCHDLVRAGLWTREGEPIVYKFTPAEMGIYVNKKKKTITQIKAELNCDIICNLNLFNPDWTGACYTKADGAVVGTDGYGYYGFGFDKDDKVLSRGWSSVDTHRNFFGCYDLIISGQCTDTEIPSWTAGHKRRTVIGMVEDKVFIYANPTVETIPQLRARLARMGASEAVVLDGGGSTQVITPNLTVVSSDATPRKVHTLFWANLSVKKPVCPYAEPAGTIRFGSLGNGAKWAQWHLNLYGYGLDVDGIFGKKSVSALKDFQSKHKDADGKPLDVDGKCGKLTRAALIGGTK